MRTLYLPSGITPGPWRFHNERVTSDSGDIFTAMYSNVPDRTGEEERNNCFLAAAGPELYDALEAFMKCERVKSATQETDLELANAADKAIFAMRKAGGFV